MKVRLTINLAANVPTPSRADGDIFDIDERTGAWLLERKYAVRLPDEIKAVPPQPAIAEAKIDEQPPAEPVGMNEPEHNETVQESAQKIKDYRQQSAKKLYSKEK